MARTTITTCPTCLQPFEHLAKYKRKYCGHSCAIKAIKPERQMSKEVRAQIADKLRGRGKGKSYIKRDGRHEHRVLMEQKLGRTLEPGEIVHHDDNDLRNNALDNLKLLPSQAEHTRIHMTGVPKKPKAFCKKGHAMVGANVMQKKNCRVCATCTREYDARWKREQRRLRREAAAKGVLNV